MAKIQPGLERISQLLRGVHFPWQSIHVAGTNGKGTICHYASSLISKKKSKLTSGAFTSPHLIDRWDCIKINNNPVDESVFRKIEQHYLDLNLKEGINASPFEILTATAFTIFNEERVRLAVVEVGMGGKLDATNILNNQAVCVIAKIARDHEGFLGNTLNDIALHKAGILRKNVPYLISPQNETNVKHVITEYGDQIGAIKTDNTVLPRSFYTSPGWQHASNQLRSMQQTNLLLAAVATIKAYESLTLRFTPTALTEDLYKISSPVNHSALNPGRLEEIKVQPVFGDPNGINTSKIKGRRIMVDGAHNPDAAKFLADHVNSVQRRKKRGEKRKTVIKPPRNGWRVTWVLAMTEGKDAEQYLSILLQPGDSVITTTFGPVDGMPWVKPMDPKKLLKIAQAVHPAITGMAMPRDGVLRALCAAKFLADPQGSIVLTGSLYLVGDFHRELRPRRAQDYMTAPEYEEDRKRFKAMLQTEEKRVRALFGNPHAQPSTQDSTIEESPFTPNTSPDLEQVDVDSEEQDPRQLERERWSNMQAELATIDNTLDAIAEEELNVLKKWAPQKDESRKEEEEKEKNGVEEKETSDEDEEHGKEQNESNEIEETDEQDMLTIQNEQAKQAESFHSPEMLEGLTMLDEKEPPKTHTTHEGDQGPVTRHQGLPEQLKMGNERT
ncbi:folylpolyglutamate synthase [Pyrenophora tritici-repentis]|uniref:FolC, Folylpolyglutamate synthase n=2 Tax=Pyrenophora tritici-repentis TaxID=45151 RepID=A0A5M9L925_9PLEO|nr:folylpolyglutamate synthase [Pyrenophora tritici-repentis Pt-1C-BFP]KAA8619689.1 folylpolyglutamate synthase [Pyrenophora tritici-repentis]EDU47060.1 folylpolyglutamate synthase [Pyrenophora tritici-repentis Pt-1C-BFP]KAF7571533.1 FolC, Folylpolyglutamate synthase [Pyrenophora tritici-repentis]KAI0580473.1 folylpolyglutamate synthase [Pyrenophora tritici-repentis]KAI0585682.1 folylpolyglutamate synthase [Pyrenophora tritici-repentis]